MLRWGRGYVEGGGVGWINRGKVFKRYRGVCDYGIKG